LQATDKLNSLKKGKGALFNSAPFGGLKGLVQNRALSKDFLSAWQTIVTGQALPQIDKV
jgi:hypothetical protein